MNTPVTNPWHNALCKKKNEKRYFTRLHGYTEARNAIISYFWDEWLSKTSKDLLTNRFFLQVFIKAGIALYIVILWYTDGAIVGITASYNKHSLVAAQSGNFTHIYLLRCLCI